MTAVCAWLPGVFHLEADGAHTKKLEWLNVSSDCVVSGDSRMPRMASSRPPSARPVSAADMPSPMYFELLQGAQCQRQQLWRWLYFVLPSHEVPGWLTPPYAYERGAADRATGGRAAQGA